MEASSVKNSASSAKKTWWQIDLGPYIQAATICSALMIAVYVISFQILDKEINLARKANTPASFQSVQLHVLESENITENESHRINYKRAYREYVNNKMQLNVHHQTVAKVILNGENKQSHLQLVTCDNDLLNISREVLDLLVPRAFDEGRFYEGQMLALSFDLNGLIINIDKPPAAALMCENA